MIWHFLAQSFAKHYFRPWFTVGEKNITYSTGCDSIDVHSPFREPVFGQGPTYEQLHSRSWLRLRPWKREISWIQKERLVIVFQAPTKNFGGGREKSVKKNKTLLNFQKFQLSKMPVVQNFHLSRELFSVSSVGSGALLPRLFEVHKKSWSSDVSVDNPLVRLPFLSWKDEHMWFVCIFRPK